MSAHCNGRTFGFNVTAAARALAVTAGIMAIFSLPVRAQDQAKEARSDAGAVLADAAAAPGAPQEPLSKDQPDEPAQGVVGASDSAPVGTADILSFRQEKVAAEMTELEERMYRLSEALKALEPENSSRLLLGLKFAREELILHQMKEAQQLLKELKLAQAVGHEKELLAKLERLAELLKSEDLDFQLQLEKLRLIREITRRLQLAIKEEDRELALSDKTGQRDRELERLRKKQLTLNELIERQQSHVDEVRPLASAETPDESSVASQSREQAQTRAATEALMKASGKSAGTPLAAAESAMGAAVKSLDDGQLGQALPRQESALEELRKELASTEAEIQKVQSLRDAVNLGALQADQSANRSLTNETAELTKKMGDSGARALSSMNGAMGNMSGAESDLQDENASAAAQDQDQALKRLKQAQSDLEEEKEKVLSALQGQIKKRVIEALTLMLEKQVAVREATTTLAPRAVEGSRQALAAVTNLGKAEGRIVEIADDIITLVEETEFGIALPSALMVVRESMISVKQSLAAADASEPVVKLELEIEEDLKSLLGAMQQMPPSRPPRDRNRRPMGPRERERELNRLIAELKMVRLMQLRVNRDTTNVDTVRPAEVEALSQDIQGQIEVVTERQVHVRDTTERLAEKRGDEL